MYGWLDFTSIANLFMHTDKLEQTDVKSTQIHQKEKGEK